MMKPVLPLDRVLDWDQLSVLTPGRSCHSPMPQFLLCKVDLRNLTLLAQSFDIYNENGIRALCFHYWLCWWLVSLCPPYLDSQRDEALAPLITLTSQGTWTCAVLFPSFPLGLNVLHKANWDLPEPAAVQGVTDADWAAGHCLASLVRVESARSHVCSKMCADFIHGEIADPE